MTVSPSITSLPAARQATRPITRLLVVLALVLGLSGGVATTVAAPAQAAGVSATVAHRALHYAASRKGTPYRYGSVGPSRFDCSGLTKWSYARAGRWIPRTAAQQYSATIRISRAQRRLGDLVFFVRNGRIHHVGVYAGANKIWHAPRTGTRVKLQTIWTSAVRYGRVR